MFLAIVLLCAWSQKVSKKMIKISSSFKLNEIHMDSPSNEDPKNIIFLGKDGRKI